ncbi:TPA: teichoic acid D-Ala incorporation-associated protein DltX [Streptococcus agalactiae]|nr:teichoic acid D-Ala incorporation-associated protein DltX [Streptococcus agalactiae]OCM87253.1 D-alanyl-lipoteichoic acid biosynthesis protein [Streptococcus agalactiae]HEO8060580.1 teichoic acid D-Ala incorporation-associated protein DltX [Streptococcus agalactiae]HEO8674406.1 teichoic acid D-Ala incorporation-associated protein DltX [Streptococcus agalactiae]
MKPYLSFIGRTLLYFGILLLLIYFFVYLGRGQGSFIYNEF